jgi:CRP-like cAMP-binding protein
MLTSFIPIISKKNETLILEGQLIDNIIFIKDGRILIFLSKKFSLFILFIALTIFSL